MPGNQPIAPGEVLISPRTRVDDGNLVSMDLLGRKQRPIPRPQRLTNLPMSCFQTLERLRFVVRNIDARNARDERAQADARFIQKRKTLNRKSRRGSYRLLHPELSDALLRIASGVFIAAGVVNMTMGGRRGQIVKDFGVFALRPGGSLELKER